MTHEAQRGKLLVVSGPSGAGKTTLLQRVLAQASVPLRLSVSATTRKPRPGETPGKHYHFLSPEEFQQRRAAGEFLECCEVYGRGVWYGTLLSEVAPGLERGEWVILEIDVEGTRSVLQQMPQAATIFIHGGSVEELERRLKARGTESPAEVERRLDVARRELAAQDLYRFHVANRDLESAVQEFLRVLETLREEPSGAACQSPAP